MNIGYAFLLAISPLIVLTSVTFAGYKLVKYFIGGESIELE